ncbi:MAG: type I-C CRISPR-associated protein Cas8c/Csd1 [Alphaproteobacteria bacterium]|nr:type I-C CRISPR-associated protein Cas8c/Csd1 [Alphaproteobacteria bacterium]
MSILASLVRAYDRLPDAPAIGYSAEKIGFLISLSRDGTVANVVDMRSGEGKKKSPALVMVPQPEKRTVAIAPNFLWDKTSYALGVTAGEGKRLADEHAAFVKRHLDTLNGETDDGLSAFRVFLENWSPEQFTAPLWHDDMKDQNVAFCLEEDRLSRVMLHDRPAAKELWGRLSSQHETTEQVCLVTGESGPVARLHPSIKGVWGGQSSGAAIVSFNLDAFESYGHEQGDNAPVSETSAFQYTTTLNRFLQRDSGHRVQIGDASTVFWADDSDPEVSVEAESLFMQWVHPGNDDASVTKRVAEKLRAIHDGRPLSDIDDKLDGVRFHVLGLSPNAARISIRFYFEDNFGTLAANYQRYLQDMKLEPPPKDANAPLWRYLIELAVLGKRENIPPNLAGDWMRAILSGSTYPLTLLSTILLRIRSDGAVNALRVSVLRAVLIRNFKMAKEAPVALDVENRNRGYLLGRLFAVYEQVQMAALGNVNASVKDKFYGSASAQPRKVFALLETGSANHLAKLGKQKPGYKVVLERTKTAIMDIMEPSADPFPASLSAEEQALFGLGYYHQRSEFFRKSTDTPEPKEAVE